MEIFKIPVSRRGLFATKPQSAPRLTKRLCVTLRLGDFVAENFHAKRAKMNSQRPPNYKKITNLIHRRETAIDYGPSTMDF